MDNRQFRLARRPNGMPVDADFELADAPLAPLADGAFRVRNRFASLDPAIRGWLSDAPSYMPPVSLGDPVRATTIGVVEESRNPEFAPGDWVLGLNAIERFSTVQAGGFTQKVDVSAVPSATNYLSVLGAVGMTAYFGLEDAGGVKPGETVLVSGAAGAVGSLVGQIAAIRGGRAVGIAGGPAKVARLTDRYGFAAGIDYRGRDEAALAADIAAACPGGANVVFENVGGTVLDAALMNLAQGARVLICGLISEYNAPAPVGARNIWQLLVKGATMRGFLVAHHVPRFAEGMAAMAGWLREGRIVHDEHIEHGLDNALPAFLRLFHGTNDGKMVLEID